MKKIVFILVVGCLMLNSCDSPKMYQEEIEDFTKFYIAVLEDVVDGEYYSEDFWDYISKLSKQTKEKNGYYAALCKVSDEHDIDSCDEFLCEKCRAKRILKYYNDITVAISDYTRVPSSSNDIKLWTFTELNTGLEGTFIINGDRWECQINGSF